METSRAVTAIVTRVAARSGPAVSSHDDERGQGLAEYSLILGLIAVVAIASLALLGSAISDLFWAPISSEFADILTNVLGIGGP